jgi:hypothetical protein
MYAARTIRFEPARNILRMLREYSRKENELQNRKNIKGGEVATLRSVK